MRSTKKNDNYLVSMRKTKQSANFEEARCLNKDRLARVKEVNASSNPEAKTQITAMLQFFRENTYLYQKENFKELGQRLKDFAKVLRGDGSFPFAEFVISQNIGDLLDMLIQPNYDQEGHASEIFYEAQEIFSYLTEIDSQAFDKFFGPRLWQIIDRILQVIEDSFETRLLKICTDFVDQVVCKGTPVSDRVLELENVFIVNEDQFTLNLYTEREKKGSKKVISELSTMLKEMMDPKNRHPTNFPLRFCTTHSTMSPLVKILPWWGMVRRVLLENQYLN